MTTGIVRYHPSWIRRTTWRNWTDSSSKTFVVYFKQTHLQVVLDVACYHLQEREVLFLQFNPCVKCIQDSGLNKYKCFTNPAPVPSVPPLSHSSSMSTHKLGIFFYLYRNLNWTASKICSKNTYSEVCCAAVRVSPLKCPVNTQYWIKGGKVKFRYILWLLIKLTASRSMRNESTVMKGEQHYVSDWRHPGQLA